MKRQVLAVLVGMSLCSLPVLAADAATASAPLKHVDLGGTYNYAGTPTQYTNDQVLNNIKALNDTLEKSVGYTGVSEAAAYIALEEKGDGLAAKLKKIPGYGDKALAMYDSFRKSVAGRLQTRFGVTEARLQEIYKEVKAARGNEEKIAAIGKTTDEKRLVAALRAPGQTRVMETTLMNALPNVAKTVDAAIDQVNENTKAIAGLQAGAAGVGTMQKNLAALDTRLTSEVNRLDTRIDRVGALTGALAGLKPMQYDPAAPTQVMAAVSTYEGKQGFALGVAHYTKENLLLHAGVAYDGDDKYMGNLGVTVKVGAGSDGAVSASPAAVRDMQAELNGLQEQNRRIRAELDALRARIR